MHPTSHFPEVHGHRGCRGLRPENTLPAFLHALQLGVNVLELDVVISADKQVVVSHEPWFSAAICRTPDGQPILPTEQQAHNIYQLSYAEIQRYDCGLTQHPGFPEQLTLPAHKPLLRTVLAECEQYCRRAGRPLVRYSVELKSTAVGDNLRHPAPDVFLELAVAELRAAQVLERTTLLCFDKRVLRQAHQVFPELPLCLLVEDEQPLAWHLAELGFQPAVYGPHFHLLTPALVSSLRELDMQLVPWTVNTPADLAQVLAFKPAGITTDYPDRLLALRS
ncbi:glycerophosphodiester phosphodiesterase family protein [Hymenobacter weizhouensis]|uniref:glycerophosphodiester phosphodiesterase family protein n=1 Tax=Hymenobacter sp. YIM 151500-1 TaxID=2987689 RepID=UPI002226FFD9|nr:glycerophosphodiester phosphodiesterase family protein [Hymenobacter sp. YIM 151500-1]UYZ62229.1 glycerophosphodiester phosphodiesterase family protein [Hymenobacter sp. YIM 151500-1]